ncbi:leucine-rich repeat-containing protein 27 [Gymnogyps californianus]|uniref:leucine-rich repeat-containing protein 27 n=1 Tax=Gymnogyps californianus TaxID=33616 RepID=UPI0021C937C7|nr:leucine-rich repeat-containing protein 27 [Gymnogyps californianus]
MDDSDSKEFNGSGDNFGAEHLKKRNLSGSNSSKEIRRAVEQCLSSSSSTLDISRKNIKHLTKEIHRLPSIKYFHLEGNVISMIPEDLFQKLPHLVWLDLRYNKIKALPPGIGYHRQLKTLLLERNPIKELPTELGNLTSLTALNLRHCPLEFPPKDVIQKGLKSILCFLRDSGNGKLLCTEPTASEMPPVEKLNLSELLQSSLDLSDEWPNEEEKQRFQKLKEEIIKDEKEGFLTYERVGATHDFIEAGKNHRKKEQLYLESASLCRTVQAKRAEKCRSVAEKELEEEQALFEQTKNNKEMLQEWHSQVKLMEEEKETFRFSPINADMIPKNAPHATDNISYYTVEEGAEKRERTPEITEERLLKVKDEATRSLREKKLEQRVKQHTQMMKARGEKLKGTSQVEMKKAKQDIETVEDLQTKLAKTKRGLLLREYRLTAFTGEFPPDSPRMQTQKIFSSSKF